MSGMLSWCFRIEKSLAVFFNWMLQNSLEQLLGAGVFLKTLA